MSTHEHVCLWVGGEGEDGRRWVGSDSLKVYHATYNFSPKIDTVTWYCIWLSDMGHGLKIVTSDIIIQQDDL